MQVDAPVVAAGFTALRMTLVVLDDDPTGTQSVANLPVLTRWTSDDIRWALDQRPAAFYVLTNTRSLDPDRAVSRVRAVVRQVIEVARERGVDVRFVSRGDSTLRGHFPLETDAIVDEIRAAGEPAPDATLLIPAFPEAGRITVDSIHYARTDQGLVPVGDSEFARDRTFGFSASDLRDYVEEKTHGAVSARSVHAVTLRTLRTGVQRTVDELRATASGIVAVDAAEENDLLVLAAALNVVEGEGTRYLYRVGPPLVRARVGQQIQPPIDAADGRAWRRRFPDVTTAHGLVVVGSHVGVSSRQLRAVREMPTPPSFVELDVTALTATSEPDRALSIVSDLAADVVRALRSGAVVLHTSRALLSGPTPEGSLEIARTVSAALVHIVRAVLAQVTPSYVLAKGGITSSDIATEGLDITRATIVGPLLPGMVSLWRAESGLVEGMPYVVFPGNVGGDESLRSVIDMLEAATAPPVIAEASDIERRADERVRQ
ncbi:four-carbon acid sugar kinase family protein [Galbitalea sp. SE-J8]|uniref:four-carbon acid sugar kinase family protein n=1 Tax=Galbitalea sp. SE-J8 TaxID=3054952 RepID=UPI00259CD6D1|nr:four-carbon acid sugar kinase family protein [Galbitalea sp. SE-J8]MDM4763006.1 four-carbon acid sugar kinase family protein [Galbitalea sp. SE-J8]